MNSAWRFSPREVDLLSWFTGPRVPLVFGGVAVAFGLAITLIVEDDPVRKLFGVLSVAVSAVAFWLVTYLVSHRRFRSDHVITIVPIGIGLIALLLSVASDWGSTIAFELRWSQIAFGLLLVSLAPYISPRRILFVGIPSFFFSVSLTAASLVMNLDPTHWPPVVDLLLGSGIILVAVVAATVFSYQVVARTLRWAASPPGPEFSSGVLGEAAKRRILQQEIASVSDRALPLLERVTATGMVTQADRDEARSLAEGMRSELVERSNRSWLESLTRKMNLAVIDQERLAERMNPGQRSALLGLLTAATGELAGLAAARIVVELRAEADGSTAVAISADRALPEGRKLTLLAPYFVTLVATVDDAAWESGEKLNVHFRVPPFGEASANAAKQNGRHHDSPPRSN